MPTIYDIKTILRTCPRQCLVTKREIHANANLHGQLR